LSLACDYRIAADNSATKIGLPEIKLGIIPGFGGCVRMPRVVGLQAALDVILAGKSVDGKKASPYSKAVAKKCGELLCREYGKRIIFTGGYFLPGSDGVTEARGMLDSLANDVPPEKVTLENEANRTWLNADCTLPLIESHERDVIIVAQQWHARRVRATFKKRWASRPDIVIRVIKARSNYGGASQRRLDHFWSFLLWDTCAFIISKFKNYC
jgi:enoyl-CoA hydratase/carnithine racemase